MMAKNNQSFQQEQRLKRKRDIRRLFEQGARYKQGPIVRYYLRCPELTQHQILFAVPKKVVRKAVARNKIKRRMREAYRLHQALITLPQGTPPLMLGFLYLGKTNRDSRYTYIEEAIVGELHHIATLI